MRSRSEAQPARRAVGAVADGVPAAVAVGEFVDGIDDPDAAPQPTTSRAAINAAGRLTTVHTLADSPGFVPVVAQAAGASRRTPYPDEVRTRGSSAAPYPMALRVACAAALALTSAACSGPATTPLPTGPGIVAEIASYEMVVGQPGRLLVALLTADNRWLSFGTVPVRFEFLGDGSGSVSPTAVPPPATAAFLPIPGSPEGTGQSPALTLAADGRGVYTVASVTFERAGYWRVIADGSLADGRRFEADAAFSVLQRPSIASIGQMAPRTDNPIVGSPGVPLAAIDSRAIDGASVPDPELHSTTIAAAIAAGHPALVVFSTPVFCVSRFCGPVTDLVADLASEYGDRADFIHVEIYRDFQAGQVNQAALDWLMPPTGDLREPWTFLIGSDGRIAASWDTVVTRSEIEPLLQALPPK